MQKNWCVFFIFLIILACSKPNNIGLEIQPSSDIIQINQSNHLLSLDIKTVRQDSISSDKIRPNLIIGENHNIFGEHNASISTQILLPSNNIDLGDITDLVIEDVYLTYDCYDYYPSINDLDTNLEFSVFELDEDLSSDSIYFSNTSFNCLTENLSLNSNIIDADTSINPDKILSIQINNSLAERIFAESSTALVDNESFLSFFKGFVIKPNFSQKNTMLYLAPNGINSKLRISYHNISNPDSTIFLDFILDQNTQRVSSFTKNNPLIENPGETYLQSMAGYSAEITLNNLDILRDSLIDKTINKATISFTAIEDLNYDSHNRFGLLYFKQDGILDFLPDYFEGDTYFGGVKNNNTYTFNITRYMHQLIHDNPNYTNTLYLRPYDVSAFDSQGNAVFLVANQTILDNSLIEVSIIYSKLE
ncbi:MAG: DUF4270 family protein [Bacteroidota bacterium]|nr:DUF4270 family protein [Bacteroidota bacterium]